MRIRRRVKVQMVDFTPRPEQYLLASIWLYVDWGYVTKKLTTEQKELWADAIDTVHEYQDAMECQPHTPVDRWWRG